MWSTRESWLVAPTGEDERTAVAAIMPSTNAVAATPPRIVLALTLTSRLSGSSASAEASLRWKRAKSWIRDRPNRRRPMSARPMARFARTRETKGSSEDAKLDAEKLNENPKAELARVNGKASGLRGFGGTNQD